MAVYTPIMDALLALLRTSCGSTFRTYSRKMVFWQDLIQKGGTPQSIKQPALIVYDGPGLGGGTMRYVREGRAPAKRILERTLVIYDRTVPGSTPAGPAIGEPGADQFYALIEAVETALTPSPSSSLGVVTLGGLVTHCWIEGDGVIVPGDLDPSGQGMATIPINILLP